MTQEQANPTKQDNNIEITKARSRVTTNTPAFYSYIPTLNAPVNSKIFNVLWEIKKRGLKASTIKNTRKALQFLAKHAKLDNVEDIKL